MSNHQLIETFYTAFQSGDADTMADCYHDQAIFSDPAFGKLENGEVRDMWRMLLERSQGKLSVAFSGVQADGENGTARWEAKYPFSKTGRMVHNRISARFKFADGKIIEHRDEFDLWKWSGMALGLPGKLLGWAPFFQQKIRNTALASLRIWQQQR
ncbi:MAG: nuclear transport factor 2 family protein [Lewinellaceae bacterium]|nr:nuclear transport factor 2 family protein [Saprospiraceae bacterium]MCB9336885.1 nuclear transport factor 2 family protein [Lewinellaceae bacterium]